MDDIARLTPTSAADEIACARATGRCVIKFTATWCGPCHRIQPLVEALAAEHGYALVLVDVDSERELCESFGVESLPTIFVCQADTEDVRVVGSDADALRACFVEGCVESCVVLPLDIVDTAIPETRSSVDDVTQN